MLSLTWELKGVNTRLVDTGVTCWSRKLRAKGRKTKNFEGNTISEKEGGVFYILGTKIYFAKFARALHTLHTLRVGSDGAAVWTQTQAPMSLVLVCTTRIIC